MLYDPKWDKNSLTGLRDWLAQQPASTPYHWPSCHDCVVGHYLASFKDEWVSYNYWCDNTPGAARAVPECFSNYVVGGGRQQMTYGQALSNLDAWMAANAIAA